MHLFGWSQQPPNRQTLSWQRSKSNLRQDGRTRLQCFASNSRHRRSAKRPGATLSTKIDHNKKFHRACIYLYMKMKAIRKLGRSETQEQGLFEVQVITPPKESLGIHAFHPNTHNGDHIEVDGKDFIVSRLCLRYKLVKGKYEKEHHRLDVQEMSRYFYNLHLDRLMKNPGKPGKL